MHLQRRLVDLTKPPGKIKMKFEGFYLKSQNAFFNARLGKHVHMEASVTLAELYKGVTKRYAQKDLKSLCHKCGG